MKTISRILVAILILSVMIQTISASEAQDYTCIDRMADKTPPEMSPSVNIDKSIEKIPLCPEGKVPISTITENIPEIVTNNIVADTDRFTKESSEMASCSSGRCYDWVTSNQYVANNGASADFTHHNPAIDPVNGIYSLAGMVLIGGQSRVEFGWRKARGDVPRFVSTWWKNNVKQCDNFGCGWVQYSNYYYPGMPINNFDDKHYDIQYYNGNWWISLNLEPLGYYPGSLWGGGFDRAYEIVYRGGVVSTVPVTTTDMGNGLWASNMNSARIYGQMYLDTLDSWNFASTEKHATSPNLYSVVSSYAGGMNYGGPGSSGSVSPSIRVVYPNGGENWKRGTTRTITWTKTGNPGANVRIQLYKGSTFVKTISTNTPNDGSFNWNIPWTIAIRNDYKIKITSTTNGAYNDWSNNNFRIS